MKYLFIFTIVVFCIFTACKNKSSKIANELPRVFNPQWVSSKNAVKLVKGQTLYLPVYSNIPYHDELSRYNLSAFVAFHNTDLFHFVEIKHVYYFDNDGNLVKDFLEGQTVRLKPLGATNFFIPESDTAGVGANFILEWQADTLVNEPLVETIMVSLTSGQGVSFTSTGKIINELR